MPKNTNGRGARRLAEAAPHCWAQALRRKANVLQPGRSCSRLPLPKAFAIASCEACTLKVPEPVCVHTQRLRTLCMTAFFTDVCHTSKKEENKLPHLEPRTQRVKDSKPPGFKDSRIQAFKDSRIQAFKGSRMERLNDSCLGICSKNNHTRPSRTQALDPPRAKHTKTPVPKHWSANINPGKSKDYPKHETTKEKTKKRHHFGQWTEKTSQVPKTPALCGLRNSQDQQ